MDAFSETAMHGVEEVLQHYNLIEEEIEEHDEGDGLTQVEGPGVIITDTDNTPGSTHQRSMSYWWIFAIMLLISSRHYQSVYLVNRFIIAYVLFSIWHSCYGFWSG